MMYAKHVLASFVLVSMYLTPTSGFAVEPVLCDPEEDPNGCECSSEVDECYEITPKKLISPDDPAKLREAAGIESHWDEERGVFVVQANVSGLTAAGVMKLNSNHGHWESRAEMFEYLGVLIGQDLSDWMCTPQVLMPLEIHQDGVTARYDQFNQDWAAANSGNIIFDAISDENGDVFFSGSGFNLFPAKSCSGSDPEAFDSEAQTGVAAQQCSTVVDSNTGVSCEPEPLGVDCGPDRCNSLGEEYAETVLRTADTIERIDNSLRCIGVNDNGTLNCDGDLSIIVRERVVADKLRVESTFFDSGNAVDPVPAKEKQDDTDAVHFKGYVQGVCSQGTVEEGTTFLPLQTREGHYDLSERRCKEGF